MSRCNITHPRPGRRGRLETRAVAVLAAALLLLCAFSSRAEDEAAPPEHPGDILIIAHESFPKKNLTFWELRSLYMRKMQDASGSVSVTVLNAKTSTFLRREFARRLLGMTQTRERRYWEDRKVIRGQTPPPALIEPPDALLTIKNGISYVFRRDMPKGPFKVLLVLPKTD